MASSARAILSVRSNCYTSGGFSFESKVFGLLCNSDLNVIRAAEGGRCDGGVYLGSLTLGADSDSRLATVVQAHEASKDKVILGLEAKKVSPTMDRTQNKTVMVWKIVMTPRQVRLASAFIVAGDLKSGVVAFIPAAWLVQQATLIQDRWTWLSKGHPTEFGYGPLPEEFLPFAMQIELLPKAVENMVDHARNPDTVIWTNPRAGNDITPSSPPMRTTVETLLPANLGMRQANYDAVEIIKAAVNSHGRSFSAHDCDICPTNGDFKFKHKETGIFSFVESKVSRCNLDEDTNTLYHEIHDLQSIIDLSKRPRFIFTSLAVWDFIFSRPRGRDYAFFLPRDALPLDWFSRRSKAQHRSSGGLEAVALKFPSKAVMKYYQVPLGDPKLLAEALERVLLTPHNPDPTKWAFKAHREIPRIYEDEETTGDDLEEASDTDFERDDNDEAKPVPGNERNEGEQGTSGLRREGLYTQVLADRDGFSFLMQMCCDSKRGLVLPLGPHAYGRFIFINWRWTDAQCERFNSVGESPTSITEIDPRTPVLIINFIHTLWRDGIKPQFPGYVLTSIVREGVPESILVCKCTSATRDDQRQRLFLLPSEKFKTPELLEAAPKINSLSNRGAISRRLMARFELVGPDHFLAYGGESLGAPSTLIKLLSAEDYATIGFGGVQVDGRRYTLLAREIITGAMKTWRDPSAWFLGPGLDEDDAIQELP